MTSESHEILHKELDLIQAVITRMAQNAFLVKGWGITLVGVLLALGSDDLLTTVQRPWLMALVLVIWVAFWYLDAYFLRQERLFRKLYEHVVANPAHPDRIRYSLQVGPFRNEVPTEASIMLSITLRLFYGVPAAMMAGLLIYFLRS